ncbi:sigma-70 family RNA polymerase sigma factor [Pseudonocardia kujensis]|uniref:sigma-70 family RNA polymerase sigma factor n=1 Tax=Pseudonocardia kujensis TaxID=1128675 RepID=UPI001E473D8A|nr:sigma-70 family RNA polymerase sigma factor [Pseudonocardia kujensis]MCE0763838.1 sigma-70 family RNA polymerase sigma factor [Pseudonocardia kujensis]
MPTTTLTLPGRARADARDGPHGYDDLEPVLREHAGAGPEDPEHETRRDYLITQFLPLVRNLAKRYATSAAVEDLEQAGVVGLIRAIDNYDPDVTAGGPLAYLVPSIRGSMLRHLRDHTWALRVPRAIKDLTVAVNRASIDLTQRLGRAPRPSEIAAELDRSLDDVVEALDALAGHRADSLDEPESETGFTPADRLGAADAGLDLVDLSGDLRRLIAELPERERTILLLRFYGEHTQTQIAEKVGISQMHVSRLLARTLAHLRAQLSG